MGKVISLDEYRLKKNAQQKFRRDFIDKFIHYLEFSRDFEGDIPFEEWFDNSDTITYTINTSMEIHDEETEDPS